MIAPRPECRVFALAAMCLASGGVAHATAAQQTYILNGYSFGGLEDVDTHALEAKFKHHKGARITRADVDEDAAILVRELKAQHIEGRLFATLAEKKGRVWIIFDVLNRPKSQFFRKAPRHLETQRFEGASLLSAKQLSDASGLRPGEPLSEGKLSDAERKIAAAYAKIIPGKKIRIAAKLQGKPDGAVVLSWTIHEPK
jgi:outer membrane protein assembly factor BamA